MKFIIKNSKTRSVIAIVYQLIFVILNYLIWKFSDIIIAEHTAAMLLILFYPILTLIIPISFFKVKNEPFNINKILVFTAFVLFLSVFLELFLYSQSGSLRIDVQYPGGKSMIYPMSIFLLQPIVSIFVFFYYINDNYIKQLSATTRMILRTISVILYSFTFYPYPKMILAGILIGIAIFVIYGRVKNILFLIGTSIILAVITSIITIYR